MRIILTGGGTAGHIIPNIAIIEELKTKSPQTELLYIGSANGPEKAMVENAGVAFQSVSCGKLRRYLSFENIKDFFRIPKGIFQSRRILKKFHPDKVFSKGGFVSVPVVIAAWMLKIPVIMHESDLSPGLANKICALFANKICVSFSESKKYFKKKNVIVTGNPVRKWLFFGSKEKGFELTSFDSRKPVVLVMGGSLGAKEINDLLFSHLPGLLKYCQVVHITGKGKGDIKTVRNKLKGYKQFEYLDQDLAHIYAISDLVVCRAGANTLAEISALKLPCILIPLSLKASRGDQIQNAKFFERENLGIYLHNTNNFASAVKSALRHAKHPEKIKESGHSAVSKILSVLL